MWQIEFSKDDHLIGSSYSVTLIDLQQEADLCPPTTPHTWMAHGNCLKQQGIPEVTFCLPGLALSLLEPVPSEH